MTAAKVSTVELVGGPLDGAFVSCPSGHMIEVTAKRKGSGKQTRPLLYRAMHSVGSQGTVWLWSGDLVSPCSCGTLHSRRNSDGALLTKCTLCGSDLA